MPRPAAVLLQDRIKDWQVVVIADDSVATRPPLWGTQIIECLLAEEIEREYGNYR